MLSRLVSSAWHTQHQENTDQEISFLNFDLTTNGDVLQN